MTSLRKALLNSLTFAFLFLGCAAAARADGVTVYTTRAAYNGASTNNQTIDFTGQAPDNGFVSHPNGLTILGVNFEGQHIDIDSGFVFKDLTTMGQFFGGPDWQSGVVLTGGRSAFFAGHNLRGLLTVTLPAGGVTAFGVDLGSYDTSFHEPMADIIITLSTGEIFSVPTAGAPNFTFFGFTTTAPVEWITFRASPGFNASSNVLMDNVTFGQAAAVPEPATLLLLGAGLAGVAARGYKHRRARRQDAR